MKTAILTFEEYESRPYNSVGSSRIRGRWLLNHWKEAEQFIFGERYDVIIYQKAYFMKHIRDYPAIKIFDMCDKDWPDKPIVEIMQYVDAIVTSTEPLAEEIKKMRGDLEIPVICIPDRVDLNEVKRIKKDYGQEKIKKAVWYGYYHNFQAMKSALWDLAERNIDLTIISDKYPVYIRGYDIEVDSREYNQDTIYQDLAEHDICLNPRLDRGKWKLKSNNKTIIAWAIGVPVATTLDELDKLDTAEAREKEAEKRLKEVKNKWNIELSVKEYQELIKKLWKRNSRKK